MASREWDYALQIKGVTLQTLSMERIAAYLREFAALLGDSARPRLSGIVKGSVVLRAVETADQPRAVTRARVRHAANDEESSAHPIYEKINALMAQDGARGVVVDRQLAVLVEFPGSHRADVDQREYIVHDTGTIDGIVVGIGGIDDTVHVRLQEAPGVVHSVAIRDMDLARKLAVQFRGNTVRVSVHGTWCRTGDGKWNPRSLYADSVEALDQRPIVEVINDLTKIRGNGWSTLDDPEAVWREIRGGD